MRRGRAGRPVAPDGAADFAPEAGRGAADPC